MLRKGVAMPPRVKITRSEIKNAAIELIRLKGTDALNARELARALGCSTQPIFSNYENMDELKADVMMGAEDIYRSYTEREIASGKYVTYKAIGMSYIKFAVSEQELFKLLFMRDRRGEESGSDYGYAEAVDVIRRNTGLSYEEATLFHLEMWICVHGIATMLATSYFTLDEELVSKILTDTYEGLKNRFAQRRKDNE